ncbi:serine hydrolase [Arthrobacter oryzae]|uniref:Beta-lactamase class A n=1 Tax=Arthrobacter oryzae TaxID=409290 RepID=A0A495FL41_9MICC|nr:serine hydrolase [Arthrobacter oryzae]RKR29935.1 beta-lactamase class A [Arthrobacter oryzae]
MSEPARDDASRGYRDHPRSKPGPGSITRRLRRHRPHYLTAAAVAFALVVAGVSAGVQSGAPVDSAAAAATPSGTAAASPLTAVPASPAPAASGAGRAASPKATPPPATAAAPKAGKVPAAVAPAAAHKPAKVPAAAARKPAAVPAAAAVAAPAISPELDGQIGAIIAANSAYALGVSLIDLSDGVVHGYGVQGNFVAASTAKILAASAYYHLVETGRASLAAPMGGTTAGDQIRQMVQQSNNNSWALILSAVGYWGIAAYAASIGITYDCTVNLLTPEEMARTLELLYAGRLLSARHTAQLLSYMQNTNFETLIPPAVPPGIEVFHKYGLLYGNLHDASILVKGSRAFVFVVYTRGLSESDMGPRTRIIQKLTRTVTGALF